MPLTDSAVRGAKPGATDRDLADGTVPGLALRVYKSGRKAWALRLRVGRRQRRLDLGEFPGTSLADARDLARAARRLAATGGDPEHAVRPPVVEAGVTVSEAVARWLETKKGNRSHHMEKRRMALHVEPELGTRPLREIALHDLAGRLHEMAFGRDPKPVEANRTFTSLRGLFGWAQAMGLRHDDPTMLLKRPVKVEPSAVRRREGTEALLGMAELARLYALAPTIDSAVLGDLVRCMILVPLRRDEWTDLAWSELRREMVADGWAGPSLAIAAARMKGRRPAIVPLPAQALAMLDARRKDQRGDYAFAVGARNAPFSGWKHAAVALRRVLKADDEWSAHTIRKSVATAMVRDLKADELLVGRILQHSSRSALGITSVYQRSDRLSEQAELLQRWADHVGKTAASLDAPAPVMALQRAR